MSDPSTPSTTNAALQRHPWIWLGLIGPVIVAAVLVAGVLLQQDGSPTAAAEADPLNYAEVVITDLTQEESFNGKLESVRGSGTLIAATQIELAFATPGRVSDLRVQVGPAVRAGDLLARVDADALAALLCLEIVYLIARSNFSRSTRVEISTPWAAA